MKGFFEAAQLDLETAKVANRERSISTCYISFTIGLMKNVSNRTLSLRK
jgi:hypothetical protein